MLNFERVSLYPFGGISFRYSQLKYTRDGQYNPNYTFLSDMVIDQSEVYLQSSRLGYQYGIGFDFAVGYNKLKTFKSIVFLKAGVNRPFWSDTYKSNEVSNYNAGIKQGDWLLTIGWKLAHKK